MFKTEVFMSRTKILKDIFDNAEDNYYSLTNEEQMIYNLKSILDAVNGLGLLSYYKGEAGAYADDAIENLYSIGIDEIAAIIESANAIFPDCLPPQDKDERNEIIDDWYGEYDALFDEWTDEILEFSAILSNEIESMIEELDV